MVTWWPGMPSVTWYAIDTLRVGPSMAWLYRELVASWVALLDGWAWWVSSRQGMMGSPRDFRFRTADPADPADAKLSPGTTNLETAEGTAQLVKSRGNTLMMFQDVSSTELCRNLEIFRNGKSTNKYLKHVSDAIRTERNQEWVTRGKCIFRYFQCIPKARQLHTHSLFEAGACWMDVSTIRRFEEWTKRCGKDERHEIVPRHTKAIKEQSFEVVSW